MAHRFDSGWREGAREVMQPRKLIMKNFGPYIHEELDFGDFQEGGLFLVSGKTGAGKTTIFDGMTFALFGETSGNLRSGKEMRSTFASPQKRRVSVFPLTINICTMRSNDVPNKS